LVAEALVDPAHHPVVEAVEHILSLPQWQDYLLEVQHSIK
jgi:hypothetical protein